MADTLDILIRLVHTPDGQTPQTYGPFEDTVTMTGADTAFGMTQTIGTSEEAVVIGDIGTLGYCLFKNEDATNFIEVGFADVSTPDDARPVKIRPGKYALFEANGTLYAKADTGSCVLRKWLLEL